MLKKISKKIILCIMLAHIQIQASPEDTQAALGAGLFAFTASAMAVRSWNKSYEQQAKISLEDKIQQQAAKEIQNKVRSNQAREKTRMQSASRLRYTQAWHDEQNATNNLVKKAVMSSLSTIPTREQELLNSLANKERFRESCDAMRHPLDILHADRVMSYDDPTYADKFFNQHITSTVTKYPEDPKNKIKNNPGCHVRIASERIFTPKNQDKNNKIIHISTMHGTWQTNGKSMGEDENHETTQEIIRHCQHKALTENAIVKLTIMKWNGQLDEKARQKSGVNIGKMLIEKIKTENSESHIEVNCLAHSYGCDVSRISMIELQKAIAQDPALRDKNISFNHAYCLASPSTTLNIANFMTEYHIYGDNDAVATIETARKKFNLNGNISLNGNIHNPNAFTNIRLKKIVDNTIQDFNHADIKSAGIKHLHLIPQAVQAYPHEKALIVISHLDDTTKNDWIKINKKWVKKDDSSPSKAETDDDGFFDSSNAIEAYQKNKTMTLIDRSRNSQNLSECHKAVEIEFNKKWPNLDPYSEKEYNQALASEAKSNPYASTLASFVGLAERCIKATTTSSQSSQDGKGSPSSQTSSEDATPNDSPHATKI